MPNARVQHMKELRKFTTRSSRQSDELSSTKRLTGMPKLPLKVSVTRAPLPVRETKMPVIWLRRPFTQVGNCCVKIIAARRVEGMTKAFELRSRIWADNGPSTYSAGRFSRTKFGFGICTFSQPKRCSLQFSPLTHCEKDKVVFLGQSNPETDMLYPQLFPIQFKAYEQLCNAVNVLRNINESRRPSTTQVDHDDNLNLLMRTIDSTWNFYHSAHEQKNSLVHDTDRSHWKYHQQETLQAAIDTAMVNALGQMSDAYMLVLAFEAAINRSTSYNLNIWPELLNPSEIVKETIRSTFTICENMCCSLLSLKVVYDEINAQYQNNANTRQEHARLSLLLGRSADATMEHKIQALAMNRLIEGLPTVKAWEQYQLRSLATRKWAHKARATYQKKDFQLQEVERKMVQYQVVVEQAGGFELMKAIEGILG